jgi:hypothetical protein
MTCLPPSPDRIASGSWTTSSPPTDVRSAPPQPNPTRKSEPLPRRQAMRRAARSRQRLNNPWRLCRSGDGSPGTLREKAHAVESDDDRGSFVSRHAEWKG